MILIQMTTSTILVTVINNIAVADTVDIIIASVITSEERESDMYRLTNVVSMNNSYCNRGLNCD